LHLRWLGTAGFAITCGAHRILIDPYVTRASLGRCLAAPLVPDARAIERYVPRADAVIVGHTHFDHALDVPAIARRSGALVLGSRSAATLCRAQGVPEAQVCDVERGPGQPPVEVEVGPFHLRFVPSAHSRLLLGRVPFPGDIAGCEDVPLRVEAYRCGAVFSVEIRAAGRTIVHLGSAELVDGEPLARDVDLVLLCAAGWTSGERVPERVVRAFSPRAILLSHWDNFLAPLDRPARVLPAIQVPRLVDRLAAASRDTPVGTLPLLGELQL
jgi:L-ascorbate metabolism protein UlaG (beta-lactamase superfamily)